jgi:gluconolactonase
MAWDFEQLSGAAEGGACGVAWDGASVLFALPGAERIMALDPGAGSVSEWRRYTGGIAGLAISSTGIVYGAQSPSRRVVSLNPDGSMTVLPYKLGGRLHNNPWGLDVDSAGRVWFSDQLADLRIPGPQVFPMLDHASVLRLTPVRGRGWDLHRMTFDTGTPTGVLLSADERTLFVAENDLSGDGARELRAYPVTDDRLGTPIVLHTFGRDYRGPHPGIRGMCLTADGDIVACAGGLASGPGPMVLVLSPDGLVLAAERSPGEPVACAFGGDALDSLFVTMADGALHAVATGLRGFAR